MIAQSYGVGATVPGFAKAVAQMEAALGAQDQPRRDAACAATLAAIEWAKAAYPDPAAVAVAEEAQRQNERNTVAAAMRAIGSRLHELAYARRRKGPLGPDLGSGFTALSDYPHRAAGVENLIGRFADAVVGRGAEHQMQRLHAVLTAPFSPSPATYPGEEAPPQTDVAVRIVRLARWGHPEEVIR